MRRLFIPFLIAFTLAPAPTGCKPAEDKKSLPPEEEQDRSQLPRELRGLPVGSKAPDVEAEDVGGETFKLSDYPGKVVLLDFWRIS